ncbi:hypothetical protein NQ318_019672 [Aromia moschata]|uniref:Dysbindin n=1 Tax=Aromia moschata TaxID=1265417 RepID=A0AAV8Z449_9CUCU|nr:hypothetical protein NQ318_019672 [Aromia moschata]
MLSSLKEKFLNVTQNVPLFSGDEKEQRARPDVNVNAGGEILKHFQDQWEEMHNTNEENASKANRVASDIDKISTKIASDKQNVALISHILLNSNLSANITNCLSSIKDLYAVSESLEKRLIELESVIEETEFQNLKVQHKYHLAQYQLKKEESLEKFKKTLEENHSKNVAEYEAKKKSIFQERQKVFQDAFKSDIELYKSLGTLPEMNNRKKQNGALLEEIQIDFDQSELDQFFSDNAK